MPNFEVLDARIASALNKIIHNSHFKRRISLEEQKAQKQDRFHRWQADCLLDLRILPGHWSPWFCRELCRPIHYQSTKWRYSGIRLKVGRNSIVHDENPAWRHLGRIVPIKNTSVWETQDRIGIVWPGDSSEEVRTWLSQIENYEWKEVSSKTFEIRILGSEMEIMRRTPRSRIREQNSVYKEFLGIVGNGKPTGSVWKETIAVSDTISISVEKLHHQIRLRILSCSRVSENHREPEVPVVECIDGLARITSKELAITHSVRSGTLQNACSTRPRVVVGWGKVLIRTPSGWWTAD